jgi:hypothetical protein
VLEDLSDDHDDEWNTPSVKGGIEKLFTQDGCVCRRFEGTGIKRNKVDVVTTKQENKKKQNLFT